MLRHPDFVCAFDGNDRSLCTDPTYDDSAIHCVLDRIPKILHLAHQPCGSHRQAQWADQKGNHQKDDAVLR